MTEMYKKRDFVGKSRLFLIISGLCILISLAAPLLFGLEVAIEFKGGTIVSYTYDGTVDESTVNKTASEILNTPVNVQTGETFGADAKQNLTISFSYENGGFTPELQGELTDALETACPDNKMEVLETNDVSPSSGKEFFLKCLVAVIFAAIILIIYIALRFKKISGWSAGLCAILALLHDLVITFGAFILFGFEINANFMAVILTILGYSINDTIVIYDRIRENQRLMPHATIAELVNVSTSQSLRRSIRTSITTLATMMIVSVIALINGVDSILSFSFPLIVGMLFGTYSSLCVAPTLWVWINKKRGKTTVAQIAKK